MGIGDDVAQSFNERNREKFFRSLFFGKISDEKLRERND